MTTEDIILTLENEEYIWAQTTIVSGAWAHRRSPNGNCILCNHPYSIHRYYMEPSYQDHSYEVMCPQCPNKLCP